VVHVDEVSRILLDQPAAPGISAANVAAETVTVADVAALARGEQPPGGATHAFSTPFEYEHELAGYMK